MVYRFLALVCCVSVLSGCFGKTASGLSVVKDFPAAGWRMLPAATTGSKPGTIIAVSSDGSVAQVAVLPSTVPVVSSTEVPPDWSSKRTDQIGLGFLFDVMNLAVPAAQKAAYQKNQTLNISIKVEGVNRETMNLTDAQDAVTAVVARLPKAGQPGSLLRSDDRLFLLVETYAVKSIDASIDQSEVVTWNLSAQLQAVASANGGTTWNDQTTLKRQFDTPMRVFALPREITLQQTGVSGTQAKYQLKPTTIDEADIIQPRMRR